MLRQSLIRTLKQTPRTATTLPTYRTLTTSTTRMGEGDTGATRSGGAAQGDAFTKREAANEDLYVRQQEMEKLRALKAKITEHKNHLNELDKNVDAALTGSNSGEKK